MKLAVRRSFWLVLPALALVGSCFAEPDGRRNAAFSPDLDAAAPAVDASPERKPMAGGNCPSDLELRTEPAEAKCQPAKTGESLPARRVVSDANAAKADVRFFTEDLFAMVKSHCGGCHVEQSQGDLNITRTNFPTKVNQELLDRIRENDLKKYMPPPGSGGKRWDDRGEGDPIRRLVTLIELWMAAGSPADYFILPASQGGTNPFFMEAALAQSLTNIGTCVPDAELVATAQVKGCDVDARFAAMKAKLTSEAGAAPEEYIGLPKRLEETDLVTFDSAELARQGVIGYAPTYPLWSDDAGKLRHVRVPFGQSIRFDKEKQDFEIPPNTRFYKTFLKKVVDDAGNERWKKIETRLIVSRPAPEESLFGTYKWDENELAAELWTEPYRDVTPFRDLVLNVVTDEVKAKEIQQKVESGELRNLTFEFEKAGILRRYGIPGRDRCIQCHMGSSSSSFVLGFTPLQVWRRPQGEGGVIEPTGPDELTQLDRLIQYGVITGLESSADIVPLERSQEPRKPRNEYELLAQSYMFGNCAHCHNPNGFPSVENPDLKPLLNFFPSKTGGIFEFPLEAYSPRIFRGVEGDIQIPYITPSLRDRIPEQANDPTQQIQTWAPKHFLYASGSIYRIDYISAPWRSLIWRNVDTPFTYSDEWAIFPHMPLNTPGYDCRAQRILGDWMVSIPAVVKDPKLDENRPTNEEIDAFVGESQRKIWEIVGALLPLDRTPQPYKEVRPEEPGYEKAKLDAQKRLDLWHSGDRYDFCPDTSDIVDREVLRGQRLTPLDGTDLTFRADGVPDQPHWVETDLTDLPPPWYPRRLDWQTILVEGKFPTIDPRSRDYEAQLQKQEAEKKVVDVLVKKAGGMTITDPFRQYALTEMPFGIWKEKPECNFSGVPRVKDFPADSRPAWMAPKGADEPVYSALPGEAIYDMICVNCHGTNADSKGIQAQKVAELTGGKSRVANFMSGLFGPVEAPGQNRERVFLDQAGVSGESWAARYLGWMALGGTNAPIPRVILQAVGRTEVLGVKRAGFYLEASPNMLAVPKELCRLVLPWNPRASTSQVNFGTGFGEGRVWILDDKSPVLIKSNGDSDLWRRVCSINNRVPVRVIDVFEPAGGGQPKTVYNYGSFYGGEAYPSDAPVGDHRGKLVNGISESNLFPWCIRRPTEATKLAFLDQYRIDGQPLPICPDAVVATPFAPDDIDAWTTRGALNAGFSVFLFLNELAHGRVDRVRYNECEKLEP